MTWLHCRGCSAAVSAIGAVSTVARVDAATAAVKLFASPSLPAHHQITQLQSYLRTARDAWRSRALADAATIVQHYDGDASRASIDKLHPGLATSEEFLESGLERLPGHRQQQWLLLPIFAAPACPVGVVAIRWRKNEPEIHWRQLLPGFLFLTESLPQPAVTTNADIAIRMQLRNLAGEAQLLPLLTYTGEAPSLAMGAVAWSATSATEAVAAAAERGWLASRHVPGLDAAWRRVPRITVTRALVTAATWTDVAIDLLSGMSAEEVATALHRFRLSPAATRELLDACPPTTRSLMEIATRGSAHGIQFHDLQIADTCWRDRGRLIVNAGVRIDALVAHESHAWYAGSVQFEGKSHQFKVLTKDIDRVGLLVWLHRFLRDKGAGVLQFDPTWNRRAIHAVTAWRPPVAAHAATAVGWCSETRRFVLPECTILPDGEVAPTYGQFKEPPPAARVSPHVELSRRNADILSRDDPEILAAWGTMLAVAANVVAPILHVEPPPIVAASTSWPVVQDIASRLGCLTAKAAVCGRHAWPSVLVGLSKMSAITLSARSRLIVRARPVEAAALGWRGEFWHVLPIARHSGAASFLDDSIRGFVAAVARSILSGRERRPDLLAEVTTAAKRWLADAGGVMPKAVKLATPQTHRPSHWLAETIRLLTANQSIRFCRSGFGGDVETMDDGSITIVWRRLHEGLQASGAGVYSIDLLRDRLAADGVNVSGDSETWRCSLPAEVWTSRITA